MPFTQTVELEMIENGKDVFKSSLYFGQMNCMTYRQINLNQPQSTSDNENNERTCVIIQYWAGDEVPSAECNRES